MDRAVSLAGAFALSLFGGWIGWASHTLVIDTVGISTLNQHLEDHERVQGELLDAIRRDIAHTRALICQGRSCAVTLEEDGGRG